jgi:LmbE family N-acetylglucosaminyl deacetylase
MDRSALVLEPHDDDLVIGIGGTVLQLLENGWEVSSIQMTDGSKGDQTSDGRFTEEELVERRRTEKEVEKDFLGYDNQEYLELEDGRVNSLLNDRGSREEVTRSITDSIDTIQPDILFVPRHDENHPDHRATYSFARNALQRSDTDPVEILYEVWQLPFTNRASGELQTHLGVNVEDVYSRKMTGIKIHQTQDYPEDPLPTDQLAEISMDKPGEELPPEHGDFSGFADGRDRHYAHIIGMTTGEDYRRAEVLGSEEEYATVDRVLPGTLDYARFNEITHGSGVPEEIE